MNNLIEKEFGLTVVHTERLNGYDNVNYKVSSSNNNYIFKTYKHSSLSHEIVKAENDTLLFLAKWSDIEIPIPIPFESKTYLKTIVINSERTTCRMLSFLNGEFLGDVPHSTAVFESLGTFLANIDLRLNTFNNQTLQARKWEWDIQYFDLNRKYIKDIPNPHDRNIVLYFFDQFEEIVKPLFPELRKQIIHNDANEWNILVKKGKVSGIIDFGDLAHSFLINELAIAITYSCYDKENPLEWAVIILRSYHNLLPLEEKEIHILYYLVAARLCTSVCNSAHMRKVNPENTYASVSEKNAWKMLYRWLSTNPINAENEFRKAVGFSQINSIPIDSVIERRQQHISPILSMSYEKPVHMVRSAFQYMYDASGNTFLDAYNNIPHVGHSHPKVVKAGQRQMARLNTNTRYLYDELAEYAEKLLAYFPGNLNKVFFVNSGSAASDLGMRLAHSHTGFEHIMVMESGYHGNTQTSIDISDYKFNNPKGKGAKKPYYKNRIARYL